MDAQRIKDYFKSKPVGMRPDKKTKGPPRWRTWSIVLVAETVRKHGVTLRKLLGLDMSMEAVPTAAAVIAARDATIAELADDKAELKAELTKEKDKLRKAAGRLATAPLRGAARDDIQPGVRQLPIDRATYWFEVDGAARRVRVLAVFFDGQEQLRRMLVRLLSEDRG